MDKGHVGRRPRDSLEGERLHGADVAAAAGRVQADLAAGLQVGHGDGAFFGAGKDGHDAAEGGRGAELGEEVDGEAEAGVVGDGDGEVEAFFGFLIWRGVRMG